MWQIVLQSPWSCCSLIKKALLVAHIPVAALIIQEQWLGKAIHFSRFHKSSKVFAWFSSSSNFNSLKCPPFFDKLGVKFAFHAVWRTVEIDAYQCYSRLLINPPDFRELCQEDGEYFLVATSSFSFFKRRLDKDYNLWTFQHLFWTQIFSNIVTKVCIFRKREKVLLESKVIGYFFNGLWEY